uniref:Uncharacterized protein n=1 Tax=Clytia hemisphaerica TaxID=252671 RepID=A0A7M5TXV8_9CNID
MAIRYILVLIAVCHFAFLFNVADAEHDRRCVFICRMRFSHCDQKKTIDGAPVGGGPKCDKPELRQQCVQDCGLRFKLENFCRGKGKSDSWCQGVFKGYLKAKMKSLL